MEVRSGGDDGEIVRGTNDALRRWVTRRQLSRAARLERWIDGWARGPGRNLRSSRRVHEHEARARRKVRTPRNTSLYFASGVTPEAAIAAQPFA